MTRNPLPRYCGFNLLEMFHLEPATPEVQPGDERDFRVSDLDLISEWGFNFVRIPMDYRHWGSWQNPFEVREAALARIDRLIDLCTARGIHVNLNFHRAPGYCVNESPNEPRNLWQDAEMQDAFCHHWSVFARRYIGIDSKRLSFNLVNEPQHIQPAMSRADHVRVITAAVGAIRAVDPARLLMFDGFDWGNTPSPELAALGGAQSCRAYWPMSVSHYGAPWVPHIKFNEPPKWPGGEHFGEHLHREDLEAHYRRWAKLFDQNVGVICGEGGAWKNTPHPVVLAWLHDVLDILKSLSIGFVLWNFRGAFGILDSERTDVAYEDLRGHKLDRALLDLLRKYA